MSLPVLINILCAQHFLPDEDGDAQADIKRGTLPAPPHASLPAAPPGMGTSRCTLPHVLTKIRTQQDWASVSALIFGMTTPPVFLTPAEVEAHYWRTVTNEFCGDRHQFHRFYCGALRRLLDDSLLPTLKPTPITFVQQVVESPQAVTEGSVTGKEASSVSLPSLESIFLEERAADRGGEPLFTLPRKRFRHESRQDAVPAATARRTSTAEVSVQRWNALSPAEKSRFHRLRDAQPMASSDLRWIINQFYLLEDSRIFLEEVNGDTMVEYNKMSAGPYRRVILTPLSLHKLQQFLVEGRAGAALTDEPRRSETRLLTLGDLDRLVWHIAANCVVFNAPENFFITAATQFASKCSKIIFDYCYDKAVSLGD